MAELKYFPTQAIKRVRLRIPVIPKFPWAFREVSQQHEWCLAIHRKGVMALSSAQWDFCDYIRSFPPWQICIFYGQPKVIGKRSNNCNLFAGVSNGEPCAAGGIYSGVKKRAIREVCFWCPLKAVIRIASNPLPHFDYLSAQREKM